MSLDGTSSSSFDSDATDADPYDYKGFGVRIPLDCILMPQMEYTQYVARFVKQACGQQSPEGVYTFRVMEDDACECTATCPPIWAADTEHGQASALEGISATASAADQATSKQSAARALLAALDQRGLLDRRHGKPSSKVLEPRLVHPETGRQYSLNLSAAAILASPVFSFADGHEIQVIDHPDQLRACPLERRLLGDDSPPSSPPSSGPSHVIGFDIEWRPEGRQFRQEGQRSAAVSVIQFSSESTTVVINLLALGTAALDCEATTGPQRSATPESIARDSASAYNASGDPDSNSQNNRADVAALDADDAALSARSCPADSPDEGADCDGAQDSATARHGADESGADAAVCNAAEASEVAARGPSGRATAARHRSRPVEACASAMRSVRGLLERADVWKVGVRAWDDAARLVRLDASVTPRGFVDLAVCAEQLGFQKLGVQSLAATLLGVRAVKDQQLMDWQQPTLSEEMVRYAAADACLCRLMFHELDSLDRHLHPGVDRWAACLYTPPKPTEPDAPRQTLGARGQGLLRSAPSPVDAGSSGHGAPGEQDGGLQPDEVDRECGDLGAADEPESDDHRVEGQPRGMSVARGRGGGAVQRQAAEPPLFESDWGQASDGLDVDQLKAAAQVEDWDVLQRWGTF